MLFISTIISLTIYVLACLGVGAGTYHLVFKQSQDFKISAGSEVANKFLLGLGILGNFWVLLALENHFSLNIVIIIVFILSLLGLFFNYELIIQTVKQLSGIYSEFIRDSWEWKFLIIFTISICVAWIFSIARIPVSDGSGFYLALAKVISSSERLTVLPGYEELTSIGLQGEMHFAALLSIGSPSSIQIFMWLTIMAGCVTLLSLGKSIGLKRHGQWLALSMVFTSSAVIELSGSGKTDLFATSLAFAAYYWALKAVSYKTHYTFVFAGIFTGLALIAKISYVVTLIPSLALILIWGIFLQGKNKNPYQIFPVSNYIVFMLSMTIVCIPHLIKNHVLFENPFAPLGMENITSQDWNGSETINKILLLIPFTITFGDYWAQMGNLSPLVLMFCPLIILLPKMQIKLNKNLVLIASASIFGLLFWFTFMPATFAPRYFLACLLLIIIPLSASIDFLISQNTHKPIKYIIVFSTISIIISTGLYYSENIFLVKKTYDFFSGKEPNCQIDPNHCSITSLVNNSLEHGERLFTNDNFRYWLRSDLIQCGLTTEEIKKYLDLDTSEQRWRFIIGRGFRSIFIANALNPLANLIRKDIDNIPDWLHTNINQDQRFIFIQLNLLEPEYESFLQCEQIFYPAWDVINITN